MTDAKEESIWCICKNVLILTDLKFDCLCKTLDNSGDVNIYNFLEWAKEKRKSIY